MKATLLATFLVLAAGAALAGLGPGDEAVQFELEDTTGHEHSLHQYLEDGNVVVLEWFNPDCPFIKKHHLNHKTMDRIFAEHADQGVVWLAINSAGKGKQGFGLERNQKAVKEYAMTFPVLLDEDGKVGKAYGAKTTPHMFVIAPDGKVAYTGAIDDDRTAGEPGELNYVDQALASILAGGKVEVAETKSYG